MALWMVLTGGNCPWPIWTTLLPLLGYGCSSSFLQGTTPDKSRGPLSTRTV